MNKINAAEKERSCFVCFLIWRMYLPEHYIKLWKWALRMPNLQEWLLIAITLASYEGSVTMHTQKWRLATAKVSTWRRAHIKFDLYFATVVNSYGAKYISWYCVIQVLFKENFLHVLTNKSINNSTINHNSNKCNLSYALFQNILHSFIAAGS